MGTQRIRVGLFFTEGISLRAWHEAGFLDREMHYYSALAQKIGAVTFFTYGTRKEDDSFVSHDALHVVFRPGWCPSSLYSVLMPFIHRGEMKRCDVYKTNQMRGAWAAVIAKKLYGKRLVVRCGYEWLSFLKKRGRKIKSFFVTFFERFTYKNADAIMLTSRHDQIFVSETFGEKISRKIQIVPNYVDTDIFRPIESEKKGVLYVGRLSGQKNLKNLILAMKGSREHLTLVGDGPLRGDLEAYAQGMCVSVAFMGKVLNKDLPHIFSQHKIFALVSLYEGNPKALLEAMSCGAACLGTDAEGMRDVLVNGMTGILCATTADSIREGLDKLLHDEGLREVLGKNARKHVLENNSLWIIVGKEQKILSVG